MEPLSKIIVECNGKRFAIEVKGDYTYGDLKYAIFKKTGVKPHLQRFDNLNLEALQKEPNATLDQLYVTNGCIVIMSSTLDEPKPSTSGMSRGAGQDNTSFEEVKKPLQQINKELKKQLPIILRKAEIIIRPRQGKNLLVLDIDQTIFDSNRIDISGSRAVRPYLHQFLAIVYADYDIIIWSATKMSAIMKKVEMLAIGNNHNYKIVAYMDCTEMGKVSIPGVYKEKVKALEVIWKKYYGYYNHKNTIICDDKAKNFYLNKSNGLLVKPYHYENYESDKELVFLSKYLQYIGNFSDLTKIDHTDWKQSIKIIK